MTEQKELSRPKGDVKSRAFSPRVVGIEEAAAYCGVSMWTMRALVKNGAVPEVQLPGIRRLLVDVADLDRLILVSKVGL